MNERSYWLDTLSAAERAFLSTDDSAIPARADVVVIGAGYTGLSAAHRLAKSGASVVVLEQHHAGFGASSRNAGQVLTGLRIDAASLVSRFGESMARRLFDASIAAIEHLEQFIAAESIDCEYERSGHLYAAWKPSHFAALREEQQILARTFRHHVELLGKDEQRRELGSARYHGVLVDERSAAINPARYVAGLAAAARRAGAQVVSGAGVERLARAGGGWTVASNRGSIEAVNVLIASNGYTGAATPELRRRLVSIGSYVVATDRLTAPQADQILPHRRMAFDSKHFLYYFRLTQDRRLLFGGRALFTQAGESATREAAEILRRGIVAVFPELRGVGIAYGWGGQVALARDERPHAGRLDDGTYFAAAYGGHGVAMATLLGDLTARRLGGEAVDFPFMDDRCPAIPFYSGRAWFLPLVGAYFQVKDWLT